MGEEQPDLGLIDGLFRHQYGRLVAGLTRVFGPARIDLVEDVVQEALLRACRSWPFRGVPEHPERWLLRVARNIAVDLIRRDRLNARAEDELRGWAEHGGAMPQPELPAGGELVDDSLRMIFTCCHPLLSPEASVALTLKTLCGFGVSEIARGLLLKEATVAQRLSRAKAKLQADGVEFAMPAPNHLPARLDAVMAASTGLPEGESFHFALNNDIVLDNRIPPMGFVNANFEGVQAEPVGYAYADGQNWDDTDYTIPPTAVSVEVAVYHQTTSKEYIEFLRDANTTNSAGMTAYNMWDMFGKSAPVEMDFVARDLFIAGDGDGDGDVDVDDLPSFVDCMAGPDATPAPLDANWDAQDCLDVYNFDVDTDVDLEDFAAMMDAVEP